jgi:putative glutamine amidotransferase
LLFNKENIVTTIYRRIWSLIIISLTFYSFNCDVETEIDKDNKVKIGIINPGVGSLRGFADLVENEVFNIDQLQFTAVSFRQAERDFLSVKKYIQERDDDLFVFRLIDGELNAENLFVRNTLSKHYNSVFKDTDGLFFLGGADFPPQVYDQKTSLLTNIHTPNRHNFELSFLFHLLGGSQDTTFVPLLSQKDNYILIGFCLGMQSINAATGGSMYQDIPTEIYNKNYVEDVLLLETDQLHQNYWQKLHPDNQMIRANFHKIVSIKPHAFFDDLLWQSNQTPSVYSSHHQAVKKPGLNIEIIATSLDNKIPEIIVHRKYKNVFGVQFHPEVSSLYDANGPSYKWFPEDTLKQSYYSFLHDHNSLSFHLKFWEKISRLFKE